MKSTGITRRIDDLGRIVIPKEIRKNLKIKENDSRRIDSYFDTAGCLRGFTYNDCVACGSSQDQRNKQAH